jgi:hypothetical protein
LPFKIWFGGREEGDFLFTKRKKRRRERKEGKRKGKENLVKNEFSFIYLFLILGFELYRLSHSSSPFLC